MVRRGIDLSGIARTVRGEAKALVTLNPSVRPWQLPFAAALSSGMPMVVGAATGHIAEGGLGAVAGLSFLYLPATGLHHRIPIMMACAFAMMASYTVGLFGALVPGTAIPLIVGITILAMLFCRSHALLPPGPIFMVMTAAIAAFSPVEPADAARTAGFFAMGCIWAAVLAILYSAWSLRRETPATPPSLSAGDFHGALVDAIITGLVVGASLVLAGLLQFDKAYWVPVSCLAVIQGMTLRASWRRNVHRIVGTIIGLGLTWAMLPFIRSDWAVAMSVVLLTLCIETAVVRHYGFAAIFITPLTILLAEVMIPGDAQGSALMMARLVDTVVGALFGLAGAWCLHNPRIRHVLHQTLLRLSRG